MKNEASKTIPAMDDVLIGAFYRDRRSQYFTAPSHCAGEKRIKLSDVLDFVGVSIA